MKTDKTKASIFLVLVPHNDARGEIRKYSQSLFKNGFKGVYGFPNAVPIASLSKPLNSDELKYIAKSIRTAAAGEKFKTLETACASFLSDENSLTVFGPRLNFNITQDMFADTGLKIKTLISPLIVGSWLIPKTSEQHVHARANAGSQSYPPFYPFPETSFRAAAVANMFWRPVNENEEIVYKWKIGKLSWLSRPVK
ncbi:MAG: hypothetical protein FWB95_03130 [Treponema sp.]|nr:hypothetical protein [Treponema sp.]